MQTSKIAILLHLGGIEKRLLITSSSTAAIPSLPFDHNRQAKDIAFDYTSDLIALQL